ncbi:MAG: tetracycline resistance MFS efflux pump [Rhodobacterales bacterium]|nr:MAG: tetracycline resistance MFS efflux pump [Rhodobacterales bacterium]
MLNNVISRWSAKRGPMFFVLLIIFMNALGIGLIYPMMPDLMVRVGAAGVSDGAMWAGLLMVTYAGAQFLFGPIVGGISDAIGRRPVLLVALLVLTADYLVMALTTSYWLLVLVRLIGGIAGSTFITATAYLADVSPKEQRAANFGLIGAAFGAGFVAGPAIGGVLSAIDLALPFYFAAAMAAANFLGALVFLPESLPAERRRRMTQRDFNPFAALTDAFRLPGLALPLMLLFALELLNMVYPTLWSFWGRAAFGWSAAMIGTSFAAYGIGIALTQGVLLRLFIQYLGEGRTLMIGASCSALALVGFGLAPWGWLAFALMPLAWFADMVPPNLSAAMANMVDDARQGVLQGVISSLGSVAGIVAPLVFPPFFAFVSAEDAPLYWPGAPFFAAGLVMLALLPFFYQLSRRLK